MWGLDRLSSYSTPMGTPPPRRDSYSPAPRRGYPGPSPLPMRPGLQPRTSSLSLVSPGTSNVSLPPTSRGTNGASLRRRQTGGIPPNVTDPVRVLASIMGGPPRKPVSTNGHSDDVRHKPDEMDADIDFGGLSLQDFAAAEIPEQQRQNISVHTHSAQSVEECTSLSFALVSCAHRASRR